MGKLADMAAVPVEVNVNGKIYRISQLTLGDWAKMERWAETQIFENLKRRAQFLENEEDKKALSNKIINLTKAEIKRESIEYIFAASGESTLQKLLLMLRHHHPDITEIEVNELLTLTTFNEIEKRLENEEEEVTEETVRPTDN